MKDKISFCTVIILNYFGEKVLRNTIDSLLALNYPKDRYEIIIVDNNSSDKSREIINQYTEQEKNIKPLFLNENRGFAGGNNEGIKIAKGEYVILLNNDCVVERNWLLALVETAKKDNKIFAVNSKIVLYPKYFLLKVKIDPNIILTEGLIEKSPLCELNGNKKIKVLPIEQNQQYSLEIPVDYQECKKTEVTLRFQVNAKSIKKEIYKELIGIDGAYFKVLEYKIKNNILEMRLLVSFLNNGNNGGLLEKIQNAGIVVFQEGSGRDIGAKIIEQKQYYEYDFGQYEEEKEVYAACGAAVLYNKKILDKIGNLDKSFFMYYEDVEISERARLRGYKIIYCPKAVVRHLHAFSSREWSNFFIYQAEKGKLLHVFYHFPFHVFLKEYFILILKIGEVWLKIIKGFTDVQRIVKFVKGLVSVAFGIKGSSEKEKTDLGKVLQYIKILMYFPLHLPILFVERYFKHKGIHLGEINGNYQDILKGRWLFN